MTRAACTQASMAQPMPPRESFRRSCISGVAGEPSHALRFLHSIPMSAEQISILHTAADENAKQFPGPFAAAHRAGFRKDDVLVSVDGLRIRITESERIGHLLTTHVAKDQVNIVVPPGKPANGTEVAEIVGKP